jgi:hypothetical protein
MEKEANGGSSPVPPENGRRTTTTSTRDEHEGRVDHGARHILTLGEASRDGLVLVSKASRLTRLKPSTNVQTPVARTSCGGNACESR